MCRNQQVLLSFFSGVALGITKRIEGVSLPYRRAIQDSDTGILSGAYPKR